jgi:hypothetical protein
MTAECGLVAMTQPMADFTPTFRYSCGGSAYSPKLSHAREGCSVEPPLGTAPGSNRSPGEEPGGSANLKVKKRELHATGLEHPVWLSYCIRLPFIGGNHVLQPIK